MINCVLVNSHYYSFVTVIVESGIMVVRGRLSLVHI